MGNIMTNDEIERMIKNTKFLIKEKKFSEALTNYGHVIEYMLSTDRASEIRLGRAKLNMKLGNFNESLKDFDWLFKHYITQKDNKIINKAIDYLLSEANLHYKKNNCKHSKQICDLILFYIPKHDTTRTFRANLALISAQYKNALTDVEYLANQSPKDIHILTIKAELLEKFDQREEALKTYIEILKIDGKNRGAQTAKNRLTYPVYDGPNFKKEKIINIPSNKPTSDSKSWVLDEIKRQNPCNSVDGSGNVVLYSKM